MANPQGHNQRWSLDFVSDPLAAATSGMLTVIDDFNRKSLAVVVEN